MIGEILSNIKIIGIAYNKGNLMGVLETSLRLLGIIADIITIVLIVINIKVFLNSKKYFINSEYGCSIKYYFKYDEIPKKFEGGSDYLDGTIFFLNDEDNVGINYTFFLPRKSFVLKNLSIYLIDLNSIGNGSIRIRKNYRKVQYYSSIKKSLCINLSPGDALPGFVVEWEDYYGKHRYYSNTREVSNQFNKDIVYWLEEEKSI